MVAVSVIVPVYNTSQFLEKCLNSILCQSLINIEIIVVNDGSTDNSLDIILSYKDDRIIVINKDNGGLSSARNAGLNNASGEFILHVDSDDWIEANYCRDTYGFAIKNGLDMVLTNLNLVWNNNKNRTLKAIDDEIDNKIFSGDEYLGYWIKNKTLSNCCNRLIKRSLYEDNGISHPESVALGEDLVTTPRLSYLSKSIGFINKSYYNYLQNSESIMNTGTVKRVYEMINVFNILDDFFQSHNVELNTEFLKAYYYSVLISRNYDIYDPYYKKAIDEFINVILSEKLIINKSVHGVKFFLLRTLFKLSRSLEVIVFVRFINCTLIKIKNYDKR